MGEVITAEEVEAVLGTGLPTDAGGTLDRAIDREEAALRQRLGPLVGERTQRLHPPRFYSGPLTLRRFASAELGVEVDGVALDETDVLLIADGNGRVGGCIERRSGAWEGVVDVTYTPHADDEVLLQRYLIEAVREAILPDAERVVAEDRAGAALHRENAAARRRALFRDICPTSRSLSVRIRTTDRLSLPL